MRITHLGHACLLVETGTTRALIDPGTYSSGFEELRDLDAILVTHQHADHIDESRFAGLVRDNSRARLLIEAETAAAYDIGPESGLVAGDTTTVGDLRIQALGGHHAANHDAVATLGNVGLLLRDAAGVTLFHPGDSYDETPAGVDILALPLNAPWCRMSETLDFLDTVAPSATIPIHTGLLNPEGLAAYQMHVAEFGPDGVSVNALQHGETYDV